MASAAPTTTSHPAASATTRRWVFGAGPDLLLGCGLGYLLLAAGLSLLPVERSVLLTAGVLATLVTGTPHYGATLLRVYERGEDRRKYAFFAVWATLAVWAVFAVGAHDVWIGSLFLTLYVTWSPWHYTGQNYGLSVMFLRRRGIGIDRRTKRLLYTSFVSSFALAILGLHGGYEQAGYVPNDLGVPFYHLVTLGIPPTLYRACFAVGLAVCLLSTAAAAARLLSRARASDLSPVAMLVLTQTVWFTLPSVALWWSGAQIRDEYVFFHFLWVGIAHSVQYLWITTYYAMGSEGAGPRLRYLAKTLGAGAAAFTLPALLFAPGVLGTVPYQSGLALLVAAAVNLQHFILDGAIWKLRDGRVARILLAAPRARELAPVPAVPRRWAARSVWAVCGVCAAIQLTGAWEYFAVWKPAVVRGDTASAARAEKALEWIGRRNPAFHNRRAAAELAQGDTAAAAAEYHRSLALAPTADAWAGLGHLSELDAEPAEAVDAYLHALELDPNHLFSLRQAGRYWLAQGKLRRARRLLERASALAPGDPSLQADLARLQGALPDDGEG